MTTQCARAGCYLARAPHHRTDHLEPLMPTSPTPADRPADQLRAAAVRARETDLPFRAALAEWLDRQAEACEQVNPWTVGVVSTLGLHALAVARQLLGTTEGEGEPDVVAYRNTDRPGVLLCREHGAGWLGLTPLTSEDLEDGGFCTWGREYGHECGRDVLIAPTTPAASLGEVVSRLAAHAVGFQDVLDESDRGPWGALILADIAELRALANRPATDAAPPAPADRAALTSLRRLAGEAAAGVQPPTTSEADTLAAALDGLGRLIATSSRDWGTYRVDAWIWAVLVGWDCEQAVHDETCTHGALEETAAMHGWDDATVAKARRYRAAVRALATPPAAPAAPEEPTR
ncbi:hypothetical protein ABZ741_04680 [Streptomyces globisporus]|uniref:hypothetical protein n=1 Tax=Streptomyces globisporus TaxID=1908 RepID=UPI00345F4587